MASPDSLRQAIQFLHMAIAEHTDPQAKAKLASCLQNMMQVQAQDHQTVAQAGDAQQAMTQRLGAPQGPPPGAGGPPPGLIQALAAHLGGAQ